MSEKESPIFTVKGLPRGAILEEGRLLEIEVAGEGDELIRLRFTPGLLDLFLVRGGELWTRVMTKEGPGGRAQVLAREVEVISAAAPAGAQKVLLAVKPKGAPAAHYAMDPDVAASLRPQLRRAEEVARQGEPLPPPVRPAAGTA